MARFTGSRHRAVSRQELEALREIAALEGQLQALGEDIRDRRRARQRPALDLLAPSRPPAPAPHGEHVRLRGGEDIVIRPIEVGDAAQLRAGFAELSALSRYRRFLGPVSALSPADVDALTHVDHHEHEALVALDAATGDGLGVARYTCTTADAATAQVSVVVLDRWQHHGVATALLEHLAARARANGIDAFSGRMLSTDGAARRLLEHVAEPIAARRDGGTTEITARLRGTPPA